MEEMNSSSAKPGQKETIETKKTNDKENIDWSKLNNKKGGSDKNQWSWFSFFNGKDKLTADNHASSNPSFFSLWKKIFFNASNDYTHTEKKLEKEIKELIKKEISIREELRKVRGEKAEEMLHIIEEQEKSRKAKEEMLQKTREKRKEQEILDKPPAIIEIDNSKDNNKTEEQAEIKPATEKERILNEQAQQLLKTTETKTSGLFSQFFTKPAATSKINIPIKNETSQDVEKKSAFFINPKKESKKWVSPNIIETSLIKNKLIYYVDWEKHIIVLIIVILVSLSGVGFIYWSKVMKNENLDQDLLNLNFQIEEQQKNIAKMQTLNDEANLFGKKINILKKILDSRIYWTNFFQYLERNTTPDVYYHNFFGDLSGDYRLESFSKDFNSAVTLVKSFKSDPLTKDAWFDAITKQNTKMQFVFNIKIDTNLFYSIK